MSLGSKGWMSPTGKPYHFPGDQYHIQNLHPDYKVNPKHSTLERVHDVAQKGYVRFNSVPGDHEIRHAPNEIGIKTALKTLDYLKPKNGDDIWIYRGNQAHFVNGSRDARKFIQTGSGHLEESFTPRVFSYKGWASPEGKIHMFDASYEHSNMPHPDAKPLFPVPDRNSMQARMIHYQNQGFARFGVHADYSGGTYGYVHYDKKSKGGAQAARHALRHMNLDSRHTVLVKNTPGFQKEDDKEFKTPELAQRFLMKEAHDYGGLFIKGWMSPEGKPHLFDPNEHHANNLHPDVKPSLGNKPGWNDSFKQGFVRFSTIGNSHDINYSHENEKSKKTAIKTLHWLNPKKGDSIHMDPNGFTSNPKKNKTFSNPSDSYRYLINEDGVAPVNNVGSGHIAGAGVGPQGEPGVPPNKKRKRFIEFIRTKEPKEIG